MKVIVKSDFPPRSVEWKGKLYGPGKSLNLPDEDAKRLMALDLVAAVLRSSLATEDGAAPDKNAETESVKSK